MGSSPAASAPENTDTMSEAAIRDALTRILESAPFVHSDRLRRFLRFTVETTLAGKAEMLKEYLIGTEVYGRTPPYHPSVDSIVRSEARRLRGKLKEYYESVGQDDPVCIDYRPGSYVPGFRPGHGQNRAGRATPAASGELVLQGPGTATERVPGEPFSDRRGIRVAVLPFVDVSHGAVSGPCAQFITDEVIHTLVRSEGLRVTTARSVAPLVAHALDMSSLARPLDVQMVFEGTVREENNQLRITSRVVNADGFQIWSERFDTTPDSHSLFTVCERSASALISRIGPEHLFIRTQKASADASMRAVYPLVLAAEAVLDTGTVADAHLALSKFQEATAIEPGCVRSICGLALSYCQMALRGIPQSAAAVSRAEHAARRAAALDPHLILVPACMGSVLALQWKWGEAEKSFHTALGLGEHAGTYRQYALVLAARGRCAEAWSYAHKSQRIDPFSYRQKMVYTKLCHLARDYDQGVTQIADQLVYGPLPLESDLYRAMMLIALERLDEAQQIAEGLPGRAGADPVMMSAVAEVLAMCGHTATALQIARDYRLLSANSPISKFRQALLSLALDHAEKAISLLYAAYQEREAELMWLARDPRLDPIREDARFAMLLNEVMRDASSELEKATTREDRRMTRATLHASSTQRESPRRSGEPDTHRQVLRQIRRPSA
jgi:TolB-like protein/tetratricopeptide (TPR) repeat protein